MAKRTCSIADCNEPHKCRGFCSRHYWLWRDHGDPHYKPRVYRVRGDMTTRFWARVNKDGANGCWLWTGALASVNGYGVITDGGNNFLTHRVSYRLAHGEIPDGLFVCHHCDVKQCVRRRSPVPRNP